MKRISFWVVLSVFTLLPMMTQADIIIDPTTGGSNTQTIFFGNKIGQSFTADATSYSNMGLWVGDVNSSVNDFTITYELRTGSVNGTLLDSRVVNPTAGMDGFLTSDYSSVGLTIGNVYALVAFQDTGRWALRRSNSDIYAGGTAIYASAPQPTIDTGFIATSGVPEPSGMLLLGGTLLGGVLIRRRRR